MRLLLAALLLAAPAAAVQTAPVQLSVGAVDVTNGSLDLHLANTVPVAGFQLTLLDLAGNHVPITGASGGAAAAAGFSVSGGASGVMLGFSFSAATIPPSGGAHALLTTVSFGGAPNGVCPTALVISDSAGQSIAVDAGPCVAAPPVDCNGNGVDDAADLFQGASLDLDGDDVPDECQLFQAAPGALSLSAGGTQTFTLAAGGAHGGALYLVLGSLGGTAPGIPVDAVVLPLSVDAYLLFSLANANAPPYATTFGFLDGAGGGTASLTLPPGTNPAFAGATAHHAFVAFDPVLLTADFASNPMPLALTP